MHCFYVPEEAWGTSVTLENDEARHLIQVLRIQVNTEIQLLDGRGRIGRFQVREIGKKRVVLAELETQSVPRPEHDPIIALALSKAVRRGFFMEKAVELGAAAIWLWQGDMSQGKIPSGMEASLIRQMRAGAKQCKNPWIPEIMCFPGGLSELLPKLEGVENRILPWELASTETMLKPEHLTRPGKTVYVIGPEGGFSERELSMLDQANFRRVSLGPRILRCETAATLCLGLHFWANAENAAGAL